MGLSYGDLDYSKIMILADAWLDMAPDTRETVAQRMNTSTEYIARMSRHARELEAKRRDEELDWLLALVNDGPPANDPEPMAEPRHTIQVLPTTKPPKPTAPATLRDKWGQTFVYGVDDSPHNENAVPLFTGHQTREYDRVLVLNDLHIPALDLDFLEDYAIPTAKHFGIQDCVIAGDFWNGAGISRHPKKGIYPFSKEIEFGTDVLEYLCSHFRVFLEPGNHDDWFIYENGGHVNFRQAVKMMIDRDAVRSRLEVTEYDRMTIVNAGQRWTVPHQRNYSKHPLRVGSELAQKYQTNMIIPHQHSSAKGPDYYGRYTVIACGGMFDPRKLDYSNLKTSTSREMNQGFVTLVDGWAELWTPDPVQTNWASVGLEPPDREPARVLRVLDAEELAA